MPPAEARAAQFRSDIQPILAQYCYDCHADGANKGKVAFDELKTDDALVRNPELWWKVLKNVRAGLMPPAKKPQPTADEHAPAGQLDQVRRVRHRPRRPRTRAASPSGG